MIPIIMGNSQMIFDISPAFLYSNTEYPDSQIGHPLQVIIVQLYLQNPAINTILLQCPVLIGTELSYGKNHGKHQNLQCHKSQRKNQPIEIIPFHRQQDTRDSHHQQQKPYHTHLLPSEFLVPRKLIIIQQLQFLQIINHFPAG